MVGSRTISSAAVKRCPHLIMVPEHYRDDESCRCDDPWHTNMLEWGYHWQDGQWVFLRRPDDGSAEPPSKEERKDFELAHAQGLHGDVPREFCPACEKEKGADGRRCGTKQAQQDTRGGDMSERGQQIEGGSAEARERHVAAAEKLDEMQQKVGVDRGEGGGRGPGDCGEGKSRASRAVGRYEGG